jgi:hypothetical protein
MLLIADSGATKTSWVLIDAQKQIVGEYSTMGFSPIFHSSNRYYQCLKWQWRFDDVGIASNSKCAILVQVARAPSATPKYTKL